VEKASNPIISEFDLQGSYSGWKVREYRNGMYDAVNPSGSITPGFQEFTDLCAFLIDSALDSAIETTLGY
jgi:hypothetical protein